MCLPFLNLIVRYDALVRGWCVVYVGDVSKPMTTNNIPIIKLNTCNGSAVLK
jgi:hypothetical protein